MTDRADIPEQPGRVPAASYRLQLSHAQTLADARGVVPYLEALGVSELYASPLLQARPGSTHGYDVCDPSRLNQELGSADAWLELRESLRAHDLGMIVDIVPNHMAADPRHNPWWRDVLTHGPASRFAATFDIDWQQAGCEERVTVPILGAPLAEVLAAGDLRLVFEEGSFWLAYFDHRIPVEPSRAGLDASNPLQLIAELDAADGPQRESRLRALLDAIPVRLTHWSESSRSLNYRRFFDITELVGVRVERREVFDAVHAYVLDLVHQGAVTGLRVDHVDGLWDPAEYAERLSEATRRRGNRPAYIVLEKILSQDEELPDAWRGWVHGTTGYNFLNDLNGVFVDATAAPPLVATYERLTGEPSDAAALARAAKRLILDTVMAVELDRLARQLCELVPDWSGAIARQRLIEVIAAFPHYRTYVTPRGASGADARTVQAAVDEATRHQPTLASDLATLGRLLTLTSPDHDVDSCARFAMAFQQLTGPVQAKGLEDTMCYRHPILLSLNEVGSDPGQFTRTVETFHRANRRRRSRWPLEMLATSTHDTKRGEDARARLNVLTEIPDRWDAAVRRWTDVNAHLRRTVDGQPAPSLRDEYLYYQALIGAWPAMPPTTPLQAGVTDALVERLRGFMRKAVREAKDRSSWSAPHHDYEAAVEAFVTATLQGTTADDFLDVFASIQRVTARAGIVNSLSQLILKIAAPGVPDFYQGTELWDLSLVDPDNRRPVDFDHRRALLTQLSSRTGPHASLPDRRRELARLLDQAWTGEIKLFVTARGLAFRRCHRELFVWGDYIPLEATGIQAGHVVSFGRRHGGHVSLVVAPRLPVSLTDDQHPHPLGDRAWGDTAIILPPALDLAVATDVLTGEQIGVGPAENRSRLRLADVCRTLPIALLHAGPSS